MNLLIHFTKTGAMSIPTAFIEDLIATCVMELKKRMSYKGRMMKWRLLSGAFLSFILHHSPLWHAPDPASWTKLTRRHEATKKKKAKQILPLMNSFVSSRLRVRHPPLRSSLLRLTTDSPDLLAVIKQEGRV
jgi:hypothetical protein